MAKTKHPEPFLNKAYQANFETLKRAVTSGHVCLMECRQLDGSLVAVLAAVQHEDDGDISLVPLAKLFTGNPYQELLPPTI